MLNKLLRDVCAAIDLPVVALEKAFFREGYSPGDLRGGLEPLFRERGYAYLAFRSFWCRDVAFDFSRCRKIVLVRDPRDAAVSYYFSTRQSHGIPKGGPVRRWMEQKRRFFEEKGTPEDAFEDLRNMALGLKNRLLEYLALLNDGNTVFYRYEDVIFRKEEWLRHMLAFLNLAPGEEKVAAIAARHDVRPTGERPDKHIRQVTPGNFRVHLNEEQAGRLTEELGEVLRAFGYDTVVSFVPSRRGDETSLACRPLPGYSPPA